MTNAVLLVLLDVWFLVVLLCCCAGTLAGRVFVTGVALKKSFVSFSRHTMKREKSSHTKKLWYSQGTVTKKVSDRS